MSIIVAHFAEFTVGLMKINSGKLVCLSNAAIDLIVFLSNAAIDLICW